MTALLSDLDSKISNLALMKWSTYLQRSGHSVRLYRHRISSTRVRPSLPLGDWDPIVISCVFTWNRQIAGGLLRQARGQVYIGGSGWSFDSRLSPEVEACPPDYSLYGHDYAVGFCNRGCFRRCPFCFVPRMEGVVRDDRFRHPSTWVPDGFRRAMLLDNEFAEYDPFLQEELLEWFRSAGVRHCITQGYDLRIVARNTQLAHILAGNKPWSDAFTERSCYTAWDQPQNEPQIRRGLEAMLDAGFRPRELVTYVLVGFNTTHEQDLHRVRVLWREYGVRPFVMKFNNRRDDPWLNRLAWECNRPARLKRIDWEGHAA